jgi:hypothetical protein
MGGIVMAATISANSAGGGGLVSSGDASGVLALQGAGVTGFSINSFGAFFPSYTTAQKTALTGTAGMVVFDSTLAKLCVYSGSAWQTITSV